MALVSKRFAAAARSPELLRVVEVQSSLADMASFVPWLTRHGQHVRQLKFVPNPRPWPLADDEQICAALHSCLLALGAAGQLQELVLWCWFGDTDWLESILSLRRLQLYTRGLGPPLSPALGGLTHLEELTLSVEDQFEPDMRLPPSITCLEWIATSKPVPQQVG